MLGKFLRRASTPRQPIRHKGRSARPLLEALEDRTTPTAIHVTTASDAVSHSGTSLRDAIGQANTDAVAGISDTIDFTGFSAAATITLVQGQLELSGAGAGTITISGGGQISVSGNSVTRVFQVDSGVKAILTGLTIRFGAVTGSQTGGGILNNGTLTLSNSTISGSTAQAGGGIENDATLSANGITLKGNSAAQGGGIFNNGRLTLTNSTLNSNTATSSSGGGIYNNTGMLTITYGTISGNTAASDAGGIRNIGTLTLQSTIVGANTAPSNPDINGVVGPTSGHNLIGDGNGVSGISNGDGNGNIVGQAPLLGALGNYGGPTKTMAPLPGSPAHMSGGAATALISAVTTGATTLAVIDASTITSTSGVTILIDSEQMLVTDVNLVTNTLSVQRGVNGTTVASHLTGASVYLTTDQRGLARLVNGQVDIGALQTAPLVVTAASDPGGILGKLALGEAVNLANLASNADTIVFDATLFKSTITLSGASQDSAGPTALVVSQPLTIEGTGQKLLRSASVANLRLLVVQSNVTLRNLTIKGFVSQGNNGGNGWAGGGGSAGMGGAVLVLPGATLTAENCTFLANAAIGGTGGNPASAGGGGGGGGLKNAGQNNNGTVGGDGGGAFGGTGGTTLTPPGGGGSFSGGGGSGSGLNNGGNGGFGGGGGGANDIGAGTAGGAGGFGGGGGGSNIAIDNSGYGGGFGGSTGGPGGGGAGMGGAIFNEAGTLNLINCTFTQNLAQGGNGLHSGVSNSDSAAGAGLGGAILNLNGAVNLTQCTISGNSVIAGTGGAPSPTGIHGSGVANVGFDFSPGIDPPSTPANLTLVNDIVFSNAGAKDLFQSHIGFGAPSTLAASAPNIVGTINIAGGSSNISGVSTANPLLDTLQDNGGYTKTMALLFNSPALNMGQSGAGIPLTDQRGAGRDQPSDLGAYEVQHVLDPVGVPVTTATLFGPHPNASSNESFVKGLYSSFLQRVPDATGLNFWVMLLNKSTLTRAQEAQAFLNSTENRTNQVTFFYKYILGRAPDPSGLNFYVNRLKSGEDEANIITEFLLSPEFSASNDTGGFVNKLYYAVLGRAADNAGFNFWVNQITSGSQTKKQVAMAFLRSVEGVSRYVDALYVDFVKHRADQAGLDFYVNQIRNGMTFGTAEVGIAASKEFSDLAAANVP